jgi:hypothetical protein
MKSTFSRQFNTSCSVLFDGLFHALPKPAKHSVEGDLIDYRVIEGTSGAPGYVTENRYNRGVIDYICDITMVRFERPFSVTFIERPLCYLSYNPAERLPPPGSSAPRNPDAIFAADYGATPVPFVIDCDLATKDGSVTATVSIEIELEKPPGWFARRLWASQTKRWSETVFARMASLE